VAGKPSGNELGDASRGLNFMELSIVYVNWNSLDYLRDSIHSVYLYTHCVTFEIVVIDNASPEGDVESLKLEFPNLTILKSDRNLGFAGANNLGVRHSAGDYVLFLNPDTRLISPAIDVLVSRLKALPDAGIVGCKLLNTDLSVQLSSIQTYPTILNQAVDAEYLRLRWPECRLWKIAPLFDARVNLLKVDVIPGACMLLRRSVFEQVGTFSEDYFMYAEDLDLNFRVKQAGFTNYYVGETAIIHHGGRSSARQSVSQWATIMKYRAMLQLFRKTRGGAYAYCYRFAMGIVAIGRLGLLALLSPLRGLDREPLKFSFAKWRAVLKWAIGWRDVTVYQ
jgi:N-acetylglucosaminyl-diphospho-decaprenol L-rhamnosyltransferase